MTASSDQPQLTNVLVLMGTRPEAIKMFPIVHALHRSAHLAPVVITTGQHRDLVGHLMSTVVQRVDDLCRERFRATGAALATRGQIRRDGFPAAMLVHGDTSSEIAAAIAAFHLRIPVAPIPPADRADRRVPSRPDDRRAGEPGPRRGP
jgi:UDP-N-acetylglucosamine 2-epimerase